MQTLSDGVSSTDASISGGAALAGTFVSLVLYGISVLQTFIYFVRYRTDKIYLKLLVTAVFLLDTVHKFFLCVGIWHEFIQNFGNYSNLYTMDKVFLAPIVTTVLISTIIQLFFMYRIWFLGSGYFKYIFPIAVTPIILAQPFIMIYYIVKAWKVVDIGSLTNSLDLMVVAGEINTATAVIDVIIALAMCILLGQGRTRINAITDHILLHLIIVSISTGFWTAVFSVVTIVILLVLQQEFVYVGVYYPISTLYCNTLLANLNIRAFIQSIDDCEVYNISSIHIARQSRTSNIEAEENVFDHVGAKPGNA